MHQSPKEPSIEAALEGESAHKIGSTEMVASEERSMNCPDKWEYDLKLNISSDSSIKIETHDYPIQSKDSHKPGLLLFGCMQFE
jgi:hypothetical protein